MPSCLTTIPLDFIAVDARVCQQPIQERAAAGAGFTVNDANRFPGKIFYFPQPLGISPADNKPFFPMGESNDAEVFARKFFSQIRQIKFARFWIFEMRPCNVDLPLL